MRNASNKKIKYFTTKSVRHLFCCGMLVVCAYISMAQLQTDSSKKSVQYKNVIRYNLSGGLIFGIDRYIVVGYERVIRPYQSISINFGKASLPKLVSITTDSFKLKRDSKNSGVNISLDYRFYLVRENKYLAPHGLYIGPYYSYNRFKRDSQWEYIDGNINNLITTHTTFHINTIGFELGYQFILWKRLTLDFLMIGPGVGIYDYKATFEGNTDPEKRDQLLQGLQQLLTQKFPGMNYVFSDKEINANGTLNTTSIGFRYLIQIGFNF